VERAVKARVLLEVDAELVIATRIEDLSVGEFALTHGMSPERKKRSK